MSESEPRLGDPSPEAENTTARAWAILSLALFGAGVVLLLKLCHTAWQQEALFWTEEYRGANHGPWRHIPGLQQGLFYTVLIPMLSCLSALVSYLIKPNMLAAIFLLLSFFFACMVFLGFSGYVD